MEWLYLLAPLYITYYTLGFAVFVWRKEGNGLAMVMIGFVGLSILGISLWLKFS